jgi:hypothetical protein
MNKELSTGFPNCVHVMQRTLPLSPDLPEQQEHEVPLDPHPLNKVLTKPPRGQEPL